MAKQIRFDSKRKAAPTRKPADAPAVMRQLFAYQDAVRNERRFSSLGAVLNMRTAAGMLEFPREKFACALVEPKYNNENMQVLDVGGTPLLVGTWPGLADLEAATETMCNHCRANCTSCNGEKTFPCLVCGGEAGPKKLRTNNKVPCDTCQQKGEVLNPNRMGNSDPTMVLCPACHGSLMVNVFIDCEHCKMTGKTDCPACGGNGKEPTGLDLTQCDPAKVMRMMQKPVFCEKCHGKKKELLIAPQDLAPHIQSVFEGYTIIGPVLGFTLERGEGFAEKRGLVMLNCLADEEGYDVHIAVHDPTGMLQSRNMIASGMPMYILHGRFDIDSAFRDEHGKQFGR